jgi:hypothetical protein
VPQRIKSWPKRAPSSEPSPKTTRDYGI